jgi:opacity protein-like surface antigen
MEVIMPATRYTINLILLFIGLLSLYSNIACAQPFSVRTSIGAAYLPLHDWSDFFSKFSDSYYSKNNPNLYYSLSVHYDLNANHSINIGTELIQSTASLSDPTSTDDWKFQGIPITVGYEYSALRFNDHFTPFLGAGISYCISEVAGHSHLFNQTLKRYGNGYGVHASLGLKSELTQKLSMISQLRYRYSNGMAFTGSKNDVKVEFTGFDFCTGLSWSF